MATKTVTLSAPITLHRVHTELHFRDPRWREIMSIGDPYVWTPKPGEKEFVVATPIPERVAEYAERLLIDGDKAGNPDLLALLGVVDSKAVEKAIMGFFLDVDPRVVAGSTQSQTTSSSSAAGTPGSSAS